MKRGKCQNLIRAFGTSIYSSNRALYKAAIEDEQTQMSETAICAGASRADAPLVGRVVIPGDKSISHRALMLASVATGTSRLRGLLEGDDVLATAAAMQACGTDMVRSDDGEWLVTGCGPQGLRAPAAALDFGNSGTGARLAMGLLAGSGVAARFTGDASLSARPMGRIMTPLAEMGVQFDSAAGGRLPVDMSPPVPLMPVDFAPEVASAQVKSAILLAGLGAPGTVIVREAHMTRDHSENMLALFGAHLTREMEGARHSVTLHGPSRLSACDIDIPGDPSSAAFPMVAALIVPGSDVVLENVMLNKQRDGLIRVLRDMGGHIELVNPRQQAGEAIADLHVRHSALKGVSVDADMAPSMIDEYPILAVAAACAQGTTDMAGLAELRVKETDRLAAVADGLAANGVRFEAGEDRLQVTGGVVPGGGRVETRHDHRIAMSFLTLGLVAQQPVEIDDSAMIATSFPTFFELMASLGAQFKQGGA